SPARLPPAPHFPPPAPLPTSRIPTFPTPFHLPIPHSPFPIPRFIHPFPIPRFFNKMTSFLLILTSTVLVNNFVLVKFLGLCPFMGVSRQLDGAYGMALATGFVLTLAATISWVVHHWVLVPLELDYLRTL